MSQEPDFTVTQNTDNQQFEFRVEDHLAELTYRKRGKEIYLMHTWVPKPIGNRGIAAALTRYALKYAIDQGYQIVALCPYVKAYMQRHPDWREKVS